jgi:hypothetical protein
VSAQLRHGAASLTELSWLLAINRNTIEQAVRGSVEFETCGTTDRDGQRASTKLWRLVESDER